MIDNLKEVLKHTHGLGFLNMVKLTGEEDSTKVEAIADDKTVVFYGTLNGTLEGLDEGVIGLARLPVLNGYINFAPFKEVGSKIEITTQERNGKTVPAEMTFKSKDGHKAYYRFMSGEMAEDQIKVPKFRGAEWDITYSPTKKNLQDLNYFSNILSSYEANFAVNVDSKGQMNLSIGADGGDRSFVPFASGIETKFNNSWKWPLAQVLSILKLGDSAEATMKFSSQSGALQIDVKTGMGEYSYILPAKK